jgi:predicted GNAT family acetyltransferase
MALTLMQQEETLRQTHASPLATRIAFELCNDDQNEVLDFLAERPIHTVFMASIIRDNGLVSPLHRGSFFACRDECGNLDGVALIGHATLVEARTEASLAALAQTAQGCGYARMIRGESDVVKRFWQHYANTDSQPRLICSEALLEQRTPLLLREAIPDLRQACLEDLDHVVAINAEMAEEEGGVNPLKRDPKGFVERTARRIEQGRVWIWVRDGKAIFKADILADTPQAVYLEGVHVHQDERGKGLGRHCLTQLGWTLLARAELICLTVNLRTNDASAFYYKAGYRLSSYYETIYLQ